MSVVQSLGFSLGLARRWFLLAGLLASLAWCGAAGAATLPNGFAETRVATGLASPTAMAIAPDGRIFVAQQGGALRVVKNGALLAQPFLTVSVNSSGERGLLGVAFDPNFATNNFVYVYYTTSSAPIHNRVSRFTASAANPDVAAAGSEVQILNLPNLSSATNHNGGAIHFGTDGRLYIAVGDNANSANAQSFTTTLGKVLRINADGSIPADNPFLSPDHGHQPGDLGARSAQSVQLRHRPDQRPHPRQRRGRGHVGGGQPGRRGRELRLAADRGAQSCRGRRRALSDSHLPERRRVLRDHRCGVLSARPPPPFPPSMPGATSSAISAAASSGC